MLSLVYSSSRIRQYRSVSKVRSFGSLVISIHWLLIHTIPYHVPRGGGKGGGGGWKIFKGSQRFKRKLRGDQ